MSNADPQLARDEQHKIFKDQISTLKVHQIGVHVGLEKTKNYSTPFHENLFLDFLLPGLNQLH